ncbi:unnamed protein product [Pelagomonas calceolata]|uniref:Myosin motor domain-containing protein n=3 Tax=Pelagomonas calceolata TaxID=35677 RepID=A0A8J2STY2_9STRA|nr:unnamed protein product [Pelagomonas calceolata]
MAAFQGHDTTGDEPFAPGDQVYAEDGDGWRLATVQGPAGPSITLDDGSECAIDELLRCNDIDETDVASLLQIHEPAVLNCLEGRDYAFCGPNVIIARGHAHRKMAGFASNPHPEPHVYALAERAFVARSKPQVVVATGGAGAGRTRACRAVASYLTWRGGLSTESELYMDIRRTEVAVAALGHCRAGAHDRSCVATATHFTFDARDALIGARTDVFLLDAARAARPPADGESNFRVLHAAARRRGARHHILGPDDIAGGAPTDAAVADCLDGIDGAWSALEAVCLLGDGNLPGALRVLGVSEGLDVSRRTPDQHFSRQLYGGLVAAILDARNARTAAAARGRAVSVVDPLPFDACGDRRALVINALDDVLEKRFMDTVRAPFRTLVDEGVAPGRFARVPLVDDPPCRELLASADLRTCARSTHVCQLPRVDDVENTFAVRHYGGVVTYAFDECARRETSDAFRGALRRSTIDFMKRVGAATPEASLADVLDGADCAYVRCLRPSRLRADLRAARVVFAARAAAAAHPRHALSFDALAGALSEAALAATEDAAPELLAACVLAAVGVDAEWLLGKTAVFFGNAAAAAEARQKVERAAGHLDEAGTRIVAVYERMRGSGAAAAAAAAHAAEDVVLALGDALARDGRRRRRPAAAKARARARRSAVLAEECAVAASAAASRAAAAAARGRDAGEGAAAARAAAARHAASCAADLAAARAADALYVDPDALAIELAAAGLRKAPARDDPPPAPAGPTARAPPPKVGWLRVDGRRRWAELRDAVLTLRARRDDAVPADALRLDAGARAAAAGAGLSVRASVGQPLRLAAAAPADAGAWVDAIAAHAAASRQAERDAEAFRRNAPPADDDTRYFQGREPLFLYRAPSDAAPVVKRLARDAFVEARATVLGDSANFLRTPGGLWARVPAEDAVEVVEGRLFPTSATYVRRRGAAASLVASYPTRLFASAHLLEARTIEASGVFATATDEFLRLADGSGWVPLADEGGERVFFAVPRSL